MLRSPSPSVGKKGGEAACACSISTATLVGQARDKWGRIVSAVILSRDRKSNRRTWPIARLLVLFSIIQALPFLAVVTHEIVSLAASERAAFEVLVQTKADAIASGVDQRLERYTALLNTLAAAPAMQSSNLSGAIAQAGVQAGAALQRDGLPDGMLAVFYRDLSGNQLFNTRDKDRKNLPRRSETMPPEAMWRPCPSPSYPIPLPALAARPESCPRHHVSEIVKSELTGQSIIEISVPVFKNEQRFRVLSLSIDLRALDGLLGDLYKDQTRYPNRVTGVYDSQGKIAEVADIGPLALKSSSLVRAESTVRHSGWSVVVKAPRSISAKLRNALLWYAPFVGAAALFGLGGALWLGRLISQPIAEAARAARALGDGQQVGPVRSFVAEADDVISSLQKAAEQRQSVEENLREREAQLDAARAAAGVAAFQLDVAADRIVWSSRVEQLFGVSAEDIATTSAFLTYLHPTDQDRAEDKKLRLFERGGPFQTGPFRFRPPDGIDRWIVFRGHVDLDTTGRATKVIGACVDITARKLDEDHARRWQGVFDDADFGLAHVSATDDAFLEVNSAFASERGYLPQEMRNGSLLDVFPQTVRDAMRDRLSLIDQRGHQAFETEHLRKDGTIFPVFMQVTVIKDDRGRPISRVIYARNITNRKRAEARLRDSQKALHHRLQNLLIVVHEVALQSARSSLDAEHNYKFEERFSPRIDALSSLHELLLGSKSQEIAVADLVRTIVAPFLDNAARLEARGPQLFLKRSIAQDLGLALHELATNTTKYGALNRGSPAGMVSVWWTIGPAADGATRFQLTWVETGGPIVPPPERKGFGHTMLTEMMEHHGKISLQYKPAGLEWHFDAEAGESVRLDTVDLEGDQGPEYGNARDRPGSNRSVH